MFQIGDIVLYRLLLAQIEHIEERNGINIIIWLHWNQKTAVMMCLFKIVFSTCVHCRPKKKLWHC